MHKPVLTCSFRLMALAVAATFALSAASWTSLASAVTITENTAGTGANTFFPGNSLTTPGGGPWDDISFNWFLDSPGITPTAFGTLFLLTQEYLDTPDNLSPATPGYLATSQGISGGIYLFDPALQLQPNTTYFFYANASGFLTGGNDIPGENFYFTFTGSDPFIIEPVDANYRLSGNLSVPEPGTCTLLALGCIGLGIARRRVKHS